MTRLGLSSQTELTRRGYQQAARLRVESEMNIQPLALKSERALRCDTTEKKWSRYENLMDESRIYDEDGNDVTDDD